MAPYDLLLRDPGRTDPVGGGVRSVAAFQDLLARGLLAYRDPLGQGHHAPYDA